MIFLALGIHGFLIGNATIFNSPIAYGSSWNTDVSGDYKCTVIHTLFSSNTILCSLSKKWRKSPHKKP